MLAGYDYRSLLPYCRTDRQREVLEAVIAHGTQAAAADALGIAERNVAYMLGRIRKNATARGWSPEHGWTRTVPEGYKVHGVSAYYPPTETSPGQWVKCKEDKATQALEAFAEGLAAELKPYEPVTAPAQPQTDLLNLFVVTDYHIGAYCWKDQTGDDWDVNIAASLLLDWFGAAIKQAPDADMAVFAQLGDFLHWDGLDSVTPQSGHVLDADTRFDKLVEVATTVIRQVVRMLLARYPKVHLIMAEGNHDEASSVWLRRLMAIVYEDEPRVTVDVRPDPYYCVEWGDTSLFFHHGHKRKPKNIDQVFAAKFREVFGRTQHSYAHTGHLHSDHVVETNLMRIQQHRTLAAPDAYAARGGWMSGRSADVITYSKRHGEVGRVTLSPELVREAA